MMIEELIEAIEIGDGEKRSIGRIARRGVPINWRARLKLEFALLSKIRSLYARFWNTIARDAMRDAGLLEIKRPPFERFVSELKKLATTFAVKGYMLGATDATDGLNKVIGYDIVNVRGIETLKTKAEELAQWLTDQMSTTVKATVAEVIEQGMREGWSIRDMQEALKAKGEATLGRAETIARTTVVKSYNLGKIAELTEVGAMQVELVGCSPDCEECQDVIANNPYPVEEAESIETGLHPNHTGSWVPTTAAIENVIANA